MSPEIANPDNNQHSSRPVLPLLQVVGIRKEFPGVTALKNVDFELLSGEVHALVGENGAGKSTLINIISGLLQPTEGEIRVDGHRVQFANSAESQGLGISTITQEFNLVPQLTVSENIFLGREPVTRSGMLDRKKMRESAAKILADLGLNVELNRRVEYLGVGDRQLVEIAKALSFEFRIIMMDEPTAALNASEVDLLFEIVDRLRSQGASILYVSHRLNEIFRIADRVTVLRDGERIATKKVSEISEDDVVTLMLGHALATAANNQETSSSSGGVALSASEISVPRRLHDVSFDLHFGEVLGCAGLVGSGRYELVRALFGMVRLSHGAISLDGRKRSIDSPRDAIRAGIYMLPEDRKTEGILPDLTVLENLVFNSMAVKGNRSHVLLDWANESSLYETVRKTLSVRAHSSKQIITKLSGGNQQKVMLGRVLVGDFKVLLLNEPTRGVDVGTKLEIHQLIRELANRGYAILVSTSDVPELVAVSDRCLVLSAGRVRGLLTKEQVHEDTITAMALGRELSGGRK